MPTKDYQEQPSNKFPYGIAWKMDGKVQTARWYATERAREQGITGLHSYSAGHVISSVVAVNHSQTGHPGR